MNRSSYKQSALQETVEMNSFINNSESGPASCHTGSYAFTFLLRWKKEAAVVSNSTRSATAWIWFKDWGKRESSKEKRKNWNEWAQICYISCLLIPYFLKLWPGLYFFICFSPYFLLCHWCVDSFWDKELFLFKPFFLYLCWKWLFDAAIPLTNWLHSPNCESIN